jgi:hypothetical protein
MFVALNSCALNICRIDRCELNIMQNRRRLLYLCCYTAPVICVLERSVQSRHYSFYPAPSPFTIL